MSAVRPGTCPLHPFPQVTLDCRTLSLYCPLRSFHWWAGPADKPATCLRSFCPRAAVTLNAGLSPYSAFERFLSGGKAGSPIRCLIPQTGCRDCRHTDQQGTVSALPVTRFACPGCRGPGVCGSFPSPQTGVTLEWCWFLLGLLDA